MNGIPSGVKPGLVWTFKLRHPELGLYDEWEQHNLVPAVGINFLARAPFGDTAVITSFYMGLYTANYAPTPSTTAADIPTNMSELVAYTQAQRPLWDTEYVGGTYTNENALAEFTLTQDVTIRGGFLVSSDIKGGNTGTMLSVVRFPTPKAGYSGSTIEVGASLTYISVSN